MSREIYIQDKYFASPYLHLVQGEQNTSVYRFQMDRYENSIDRGIFTYSITGRNAQGDLNFGPLSKIVSPQSVVLEWTVGPNFTAGAGPMQLQITGRDPSGQQLAVFEGEVVEVAPNLSDTYETTPDYAQQILEGAKEAASRAESAAEGIEDAENRSEEYARQAGESAASAKSDADRAAQMIGEGEEIRENVEAWIEDIRGILTQDVAGELAAGVADLNADVQTLDTEMETKASRVQDAVSGNLAMLSENGDLQDSGKAASPLDAERLAGKEAWEYRRGRNLLDNWHFGNPVNQRGQTTYSSNGVSVYSIDRWKIGGVPSGNWSFTLSGGGIQLSFQTAIQQVFEKVNWDQQTVTCSILLDDTLLSGTFIWNSSNGYTEIQNFGNGYRLAYSGTAKYLQIYNASGTGALVLKAAKLELGDTQTLAHQDADGNWVLNDAPPNFGEELAKCQRYQQVFSTIERVPYSYANTDRIDFFVPTPVPLRASPAFSVNNMSVLDQSGSIRDGFTFSVFSLNPNGVMVTANKKAHGITDGILQVCTNTEKTIFDANL